MRQVSVEVGQIQAGRYVIMPCTFYRGRERGFALRVYTPPLKSGARARSDIVSVTRLNGDAPSEQMVEVAAQKAGDS